MMAITKTEGVCGGRACIKGTRIAVWALVREIQVEMGLQELLDEYQHIDIVDLVEALFYAIQNHDEIMKDIEDNVS